MSTKPVLYRRRYIPDELKCLKDDEILRYEPGRLLITRWNTFTEKTDFATGTSVYFIDRDIRVSKFRDKDGNLVRWYCDIIEIVETEDTFTYNDLLFDVVELPDGTIQVVDIGEAAEAFEKGLITRAQLLKGMYALDSLLESIRTGAFEECKRLVDEVERM